MCMCECVLFKKVEYVLKMVEADVYVFVAMIYHLVQKRRIIYVESMLTSSSALTSYAHYTEPRGTNCSPLADTQLCPELEGQLKGAPFGSAKKRALLLHSNPAEPNRELRFGQATRSITPVIRKRTERYMLTLEVVPISLGCLSCLYKGHVCPSRYGGHTVTTQNFVTSTHPKDLSKSTNRDIEQDGNRCSNQHFPNRHCWRRYRRLSYCMITLWVFGSNVPTAIRTSCTH